jgi:hypothetical protein
MRIYNNGIIDIFENEFFYSLPLTILLVDFNGNWIIQNPNTCAKVTINVTQAIIQNLNRTCNQYSDIYSVNALLNYTGKGNIYIYSSGNSLILRDTDFVYLQNSQSVNGIVTATNIRDISANSIIYMSRQTFLNLMKLLLVEYHLLI